MTAPDVAAWVVERLLGFGLGGVAGSLTTVLLTPRLRHVFYRRERLEDLQREAIREFNRLSASFITERIDAERKGESYRPTTEFFRDLQIVNADVVALFPSKAAAAYLQFEKLVGPRSEIGIEDLVEARDNAMCALYRSFLPI